MLAGLVGVELLFRAHFSPRVIHVVQGGSNGVHRTFQRRFLVLGARLEVVGASKVYVRPES